MTTPDEVRPRRGERTLFLGGPWHGRLAFVAYTGSTLPATYPVMGIPKLVARTYAGEEPPEWGVRPPIIVYGLRQVRGVDQFMRPRSGFVYTTSDYQGGDEAAADALRTAVGLPTW